MGVRGVSMLVVPVLAEGESGTENETEIEIVGIEAVGTIGGAEMI